ncbi:endonuclease/exonuclease/phosphatase family protein [Streptomyces iranensis]|uniref:Endonuclease/exonuclease/phosphatase n=2 Tax=Streptomyces iranensis TaxID=576784 RepID=A0A060ZU49_9ACTN|nr:vancomycin resistance protein VanJ [Streptomyces iranensis]CDR09655.1 Endonuclease/exonuclease/phosphatase [Streptomyces iranensis]
MAPDHSPRGPGAGVAKPPRPERAGTGPQEGPPAAPGTGRPRIEAVRRRLPTTGVRCRRRGRGRVVAGLAAADALVMLGHAWIPNRVGHLGSLVETFLPWTGLAVPPLLLCALVRRSATAVVAVVLPALTWCSLFGGMLLDKRADGGGLTVVTHNVDEHNPHPVRTARALAASGADVLALEELGAATAAYERTLAGTYPYRVVRGTVGLWSRYPVDSSRPVDIAPWPRSLRAVVRTPEGPVAVFVAHLLSVRFGATSGFTASARDAAARRLGTALRAEPLRRTVLVGDLNGTLDDRGLSAVTSRLRSAQAEAGAGFGLTWPASFPVARIDHILVRGVDPRASWTLPATGSDHLPVAARLRL